MKLNLTKPIVFFDLETTGIDVATDRIVELSLVRIEPNGNRQSMTMRINPERPIPAEASDVHGIYDADVQDCPTFRDKAEELKRLFEGCDLAGFNSNRFDIPLLAEEFIRAGVVIDLNTPRHVDVQNIYHKLERRTLVAAYKFYCNKDLENAHTAQADTVATYEVLKAQLDRYPEQLKNDVDFLAEFSRRGRNVDLAGRIVLDDKGVETINFGKYRGQSVVSVLRRDTGYFNWIMQGDFPQNTKQEFMRIRLREGIK